MARVDLRNRANAAGDWFVDTRCIDCGTCREISPALFADEHGGSVVCRQPDPAEEVDAWLAAQACPTRSIGTVSRRPRPGRLYPREVEPGSGVHDLGHCSEDSFGASAWLVQRPHGNVLVDSPRFTEALVAPITDLGGIAHVALTHQDDVADAGRWADRFGARVWIHAADRAAAPFATDLVTGIDDTEVQPGFVAVPVPLALHRGLPGVEPRARRPHRLPQRLLALVEHAAGLARSPRRPPPVRVGAARPRGAGQR
jgi:ferredoxin